MNDEAVGKLDFLRRYGPIARNDNMYDETIQRAARRADVAPITFDHPKRDEVLASFKGSSPCVGRLVHPCDDIYLFVARMN